jgi:uncharacterized lipoprotein
MIRKTTLILLLVFSSLLTACVTSEHSKKQQPAPDTQTNNSDVQIYTADTSSVVDDTQTQDAATDVVKPSVAQTRTSSPKIPPALKPATSTDPRSLTLNLAYQKAWVDVKKALPQAGYPIMEQDNASGTYYFLDKVGAGGMIRRNAPIYQLNLQNRQDHQTVVTLKDAQNKPAPLEMTKRIFNVLKQKLPTI